MKSCKATLCVFMIWCGIVLGCNNAINVREDKVYSRHLRAHIRLTVISTPIPDNKSDMHLLLLNDGQESDKFRVKEVLDSLNERNSIQPLVVVAVHGNDRMKEYGVSGMPDYRGNGSRADKYASFIDNELYNYAKKKAGVRKFKTVGIAGCSLGGLSAFDIAWDNAGKIDIVGVFSGSFWWRDKDATEEGYDDQTNRILLRKVTVSRKKPALKYWFYAGGNEENGDRDKDGIVDVVDDTRDLVEIIKRKNVCPPGDIIYREEAAGRHDYVSWSKMLPEFLVWAYGK